MEPTWLQAQPFQGWSVEINPVRSTERASGTPDYQLRGRGSLAASSAFAFMASCWRASDTVAIERTNMRRAPDTKALSCAGGTAGAQVLLEVAVPGEDVC